MLPISFLIQGLDPSWTVLYCNLTRYIAYKENPKEDLEDPEVVSGKSISTCFLSQCAKWCFKCAHGIRVNHWDFAPKSTWTESPARNVVSSCFNVILVVLQFFRIYLNFPKNIGVKSQISEVFSDVSDVKWHLPPSGQLRGRVGCLVFLFDSREGWERNGKTGYVTLRAQRLHNFIANCSFFLFLGANGVGWLGRYFRDFGEWLVIQTWTGRVLSKFTVLLSQLRLFWLEIWKLRMVLVFFLCVGCFFDFWLGIVQNDWFTGKKQLPDQRSMSNQGVINCCVVEFGGQVFESIRQLIMFVGCTALRLLTPQKNGYFEDLNTPALDTGSGPLSIGGSNRGFLGWYHLWKFQEFSRGGSRGWKFHPVLVATARKPINSPGSPTSIFLFWPGKLLSIGGVQPSQEGEPWKCWVNEKQTMAEVIAMEQNHPPWN